MTKIDGIQITSNSSDGILSIRSSGKVRSVSYIPNPAELVVDSSLGNFIVTLEDIARLIEQKQKELDASTIHVESKSPAIGGKKWQLTSS